MTHSPVVVKAGIRIISSRLPRNLKLAVAFENEAYLKAEAKARGAKLNMWSLGEKYISPREWRRMHK